MVSVEAICLGFLFAQMNNLCCVTGDVGKIFLTSFTIEKHFIIAGPEFGADIEEKQLFIEKLIYGTRSAVARFHEYLSNKLHKIKYRPSRANPDLWMRKLKDGSYEYSTIRS